MDQSVFIGLGKYGDIILMLPAFKAVCDRTGNKPKVIICKQYASLLEGVSYVDPVVVDLDYQDVHKAIAFAKQRFGDSINPCWWHDKDLPEKIEGGIVLRVHGKEWSVDHSKYPHFMGSMYVRSGFSLNEMMVLPLVFDRRDKEREKKLLNTFTSTDKRPLLLLSFSGETSPLATVPEIMQHINPFRNRYNILRLDNLRCHRIYDLLGLMDAAVGMITIDTATLHLAHASKTPYIAFTRDGWSGSVPRGNCISEIKYSQAIKNGQTIRNALEQWLQPKVTPRIGPQLGPSPIKRECWMLERHRIPAKNVTLWGCCWSDNMDIYSKTIRVLRYCSTLFDFERIIFFAYHVSKSLPCEFVQIPKFTSIDGFNVFVNSVVPHIIKSEFAMAIHEDGFPVRPDLWDNRFLEYDYIGAPWTDGFVGNGGFSIESSRMLKEKTTLPPSSNPAYPSDNYVCRVHRTTLLQKGIKFAPTDLALKFSTEMTGRGVPSFGFHSRNFQPEKYALGWNNIAQSEK